MKTTLLELLTSNKYVKTMKAEKYDGAGLVEVIKDETLELFDSVVPKTKVVSDFEEVYLLIPTVENYKEELFSDKEGSIVMEVKEVKLLCSNADDFKVVKLSIKSSASTYYTP